MFTVDLLACQSTCCGFAALLRHVAGFPDLGLLRGLRPIPGSSVDDEPARRRPGWAAGRAIPRWFPRSPCTGRRGRCPALLRQPRHTYAAGLRGGLPTGIRNRLRSRPPTVWWSCTADRPTSTRLEPASRLRSFTHWFKLRLHLPITLAGPGPSGGADPSRRCRGCSHPHLRPQARLPPASKTCCDRPTAESFHPHPVHGASWRTRTTRPNDGLKLVPSRTERHLRTSSYRCCFRTNRVPPRSTTSLPRPSGSTVASSR